MSASHSTAAWQRTRLAILHRDLFTCQMCGIILTSGKHSPRAAVVDHLIPETLRPDLFLEDSNLRSTCKSCHDGPCASIEAKHAPDGDAIRAAKLATHRIGVDGWPISSNAPHA